MKDNRETRLEQDGGLLSERMAWERQLIVIAEESGVFALLDKVEAAAAAIAHATCCSQLSTQPPGTRSLITEWSRVS